VLVKNLRILKLKFQNAPSDPIRTASSNPGLTQGLTGRFQYLGGIMVKSRFLRRNYNNLGKCGGNVGKSHFLRRNYGKLSFFEGGIITTSVIYVYVVVY
jgi:hypothetical protein